jgi:hypothetical protein
MRLSGWMGHEELTPLDPAVRSDAQERTIGRVPG